MRGRQKKGTSLIWERSCKSFSTKGRTHYEITLVAICPSSGSSMEASLHPSLLEAIRDSGLNSDELATTLKPLLQSISVRPEFLGHSTAAAAATPREHPSGLPYVTNYHPCVTNATPSRFLRTHTIGTRPPDRQSLVNLRICSRCSRLIWRE